MVGALAEPRSGLAGYLVADCRWRCRSIWLSSTAVHGDEKRHDAVGCENGFTGVTRVGYLLARVGYLLATFPQCHLPRLSTSSNPLYNEGRVALTYVVDTVGCCD